MVKHSFVLYVTVPFKNHDPCLQIGILVPQFSSDDGAVKIKYLDLYNLYNGLYHGLFCFVKRCFGSFN